MKGWEVTRLKLKRKFSEMGIEWCELGYKGCWHTNALSFAHSMKRRKIQTQEELEEVVLACIPCHKILEEKPAPKMLEEVREKIRARNGGEFIVD